MVQFNEWFDKRAKTPPIRDLFISWLENKGIQGAYDAAFEPETLEEEWLSFLFYLGRKISKLTSISNTKEITVTENKMYDEIKEATKEELLEAAIHFWRSGADDDYTAHLIEKWMRLGFALAQKDGWMKVAPAWLKDYWKHIEIPF